MRASRRLLRRGGMSLLEVIVALAIFLLLVVGLYQLIGVAGERAYEVSVRSQATRLARTKLSEVQAGILPLESRSEQEFDENEDEEARNFLWSVDVNPSQSDVPDLYEVVVRVAKPRGDGSKIEVVLTQLVLDPAKVGNAQDSAPVAGSDTSTAPANATPAAPAAPAAPAGPAQGQPGPGGS